MSEFVQIFCISFLIAMQVLINNYYKDKIKKSENDVCNLEIEVGRLKYLEEINGK